MNAFERRPHSDAAPGLHRRYEVGAPHITRLLFALAPSDADFPRAGRLGDFAGRL